MSAEKEKPKPEAAATAEAPPKGKPIKVIAIVAVLMAVEGVAVFMIASMTGPKHAEAAKHVEGVDQTDHEAAVEIQLVDDRFQNMQTGRVWVWDSEIVLKVKTKNEAFVTKVLETRSAEMKEGVALIFRRAQHSQLKEPGLETVNKQLSVYLNEIIGKDGEGHDRIERVVIPKCKGYPAE